MAGKDLLRLRDVLVRHGWAAGKAQFLATLLLRQRVSTTEMAREIGTTELHARRIYHALDRAGLVDAEPEHRKPRGRRINVYHLRDPEVLLLQLAEEAEADARLLRSLASV